MSASAVSVLDRCDVAPLTLPELPVVVWLPKRLPRECESAWSALH